MVRMLSGKRKVCVCVHVCVLQSILYYLNPFGLEVVRIVQITEIIPNVSINNTITPFLLV